MKSILIFTEEYDSESLADMFRDIEENLHHEDVECDEYGFSKGTYKVIVTYTEEDV